MSGLQKKLQMQKLPPMPPPGVGVGGKRGFGMPGRKRDYTPVSWDKYFEKMEDVRVGDDTFRVYSSGSEGPVCLFLHGGGFSALSWALLVNILTQHVTCQCVAMDLRAHGDTATQDEENVSADRLAGDVAAVVSAMYGEDPPHIILVGHSMGGALGVHVASKNLLPSLIGLAVIDVVEGTAMEALNSMQGFLRSRPDRFKSLEQGIEWCVRSGHIRNVESAKVSMIGQLKKLRTNETATSELQHQNEVNGHEVLTNPNVIAEEEDVASSSNAQPPPVPSTAATQDTSRKRPLSAPEVSQSYTWRINLTNTEKYWRGWFEGLSNLFLSVPVPKMLLLAGVDRLDKELTVGQMQGKFQMQVIAQSGHAVHEDVPDKVADILATFMVRHRVATPKESFQCTFPAC